MAVNKKGKRKVNYKGRQFLWYVQEQKAQIPADGGFIDHDPVRMVHIIATNKKFIVHYQIPGAGDNHALLRIEGQQFPRRPGAKEIQVPRWKNDSKKYPTNDFIRRLIHWCMSTD